jgi:hypothetical protein
MNLHSSLRDRECGRMIQEQRHRKRVREGGRRPVRRKEIMLGTTWIQR